MNEIAARLQINGDADQPYPKAGGGEAGLIRVTQDVSGHGNQKVQRVFGNPNPGGEIGTRGDRRRQYFPGRNPGGAVFGLSGISHLRHFHDEKDDR